MWYDLLGAGVPREEIGTAAMFEKWTNVVKGSKKKVFSACKDLTDITTPSAPTVPFPPPNYTDVLPSVAAPLTQDGAHHSVTTPVTQDGTPLHVYTHVPPLINWPYSHTMPIKNQIPPESDGKVRSLYPVTDLRAHDLIDWDETSKN